MKYLRDFNITRREFLHKTGLIGAALSTYPAYAMHSAPPAARVMDTSRLARFVDPLPIPKVLTPQEFRPNPANSKEKVPYFRLNMREAETRLHRDLKPTRFWGFDSSLPGPTIEAHSSRGVLVEWVNDLPKSHFLPIDHNLEGAERDKPEVRTVVHLHGGRVPPESDGYPEDWIVSGKSSVNFYPNNQDAATLWYHDHAMGINRLNMYAGLFGLYLIRDEFEEQLKVPAGEYEIPLVLCDRMLDKDGQLFYPVSPNSKAPWVPEVFGDALLVNGKILPIFGCRAPRVQVSNSQCGEWSFFSPCLCERNGTSANRS